MSGIGVECQVCKNEEAVAVAAAPGIPMSLAYGPACISGGFSYPVWLMVANTALMDGYDNAADWWKQEVERHLTHFEVSMEDFLGQVAESMKELEKMEGPEWH